MQKSHIIIGEGDPTLRVGLVPVRVSAAIVHGSEASTTILGSSLMKPPYFLNESSRVDLRGDLNLFETESALLSYVEPIDVENGEYFAFDADGHLLSLSVDGGEVQLKEAEAEPGHADVLAQLMRDSLANLQLPEDWPAASSGWATSADLPDLVARAVEVDQAWRSRRPAAMASPPVRPPSSSAHRRS
jgi:hypothetical protein